MDASSDPHAGPVPVSWRHCALAPPRAHGQPLCDARLRERPEDFRVVEDALDGARLPAVDAAHRDAVTRVAGLRARLRLLRAAIADERNLGAAACREQADAVADGTGAAEHVDATPRHVRLHRDSGLNRRVGGVTKIIEIGRRELAHALDGDDRLFKFLLRIAHDTVPLW